MDGTGVASIVLGTIGTITGCYATWLTHKATRQELTLVRADQRLLRFRVVNYSTRPIPIESVLLELKDEGTFRPSQDTPSLKGITLPGVLAPESSFDVAWAGTRQVVEMIFHGEFRLSVTTQIGKRFSIEGTSKSPTTRRTTTTCPADGAS